MWNWLYEEALKEGMLELPLTPATGIMADLDEDARLRTRLEAHGH